MLVDRNEPPIPHDHVPLLAERTGGQRGQDGPLLVVQVHVRAGDLAGPFGEAHLVSELADHSAVALAHFAQAKACSSHVAINDLLGADHALRQPRKEVPALPLHHRVLQGRLTPVEGSPTPRQEPGQPDRLPVRDLLSLDRRPHRSLLDNAIAALGALEVVVVHQLAAQVGEVLVNAEEHLVHLGLGVDPARLETGEHLEQRACPGLAPGRDLRQPAVGEVPTDQPFLLPARCVVRRRVGRPSRRRPRRSLLLESGSGDRVGLTGLGHPSADNLLEVMVPGHCLHLACVASPVRRRSACGATSAM